jgi:hypothetical protein
MCPVNMAIWAQKTGGLSDSPLIQNGSFLKRSSNDFGQSCMETIPRTVFREVTARSLGARTRNVVVIEAGSTGGTDFIVVRYS